MTKEKRERLITRLEKESAKIKNKFAILVDKTRESLEKQKVLPKDLVILIEHSNKSSMTKLFQDNEDIHTLFFQLKNYWSFFDYELLDLIIQRHSPELRQNLFEYVDDFKIFCKRRICELPADILKIKERNNSMHIKIDKTFGELKLIEIKDLEYNLSELFNTEVYLLSIREGCVELQFEPLHDIHDVFPLNSEKINKLHILGVTEIWYNEHHIRVIDQATEHTDPKSML